LGDIERFPPFRGEPMSPVPRSPWAASEPLGGLGSPSGPGAATAWAPIRTTRPRRASLLNRGDAAAAIENLKHLTGLAELADVRTILDRQVEEEWNRRFPRPLGPGQR